MGIDEELDAIIVLSAVVAQTANTLAYLTRRPWHPNREIIVNEMKERLKEVIRDRNDFVNNVFARSVTHADVIEILEVKL